MAGTGEGAARGGSGLGFIPWLLGFIISTFSIATLFYQGIVAHDASAPIQALLDAYHDAIGIVFDPIEPYVRDAARWLGSLVGWDVEIHPIWRDVFVLLSVYWASFMHVVWVMGQGKWVLLYGVPGIISSLVVAWTLAVLPLGSERVMVQGLIASLPLVAIMLTYGMIYLALRGCCVVAA